MLEKEIVVYNQHLTDWLSTNGGKFVAIKDDNIIGFFDTFESALSEAAKRYGLDSYLIRRVSPKQDDIIVPALTLGLLRANIPLPARS
jgi:hypothetical protein